MDALYQGFLKYRRSQPPLTTLLVSILVGLLTAIGMAMILLPLFGVKGLQSLVYPVGMICSTIAILVGLYLIDPDKIP